ncbi:RES domain-containing protein [Faecalibacterium duncaniae]
MSKSLRRSDSTLDYVPTQYIVDFIKSIEHNGTREYAGVEYSSTTNPDGYNLAIFEPELFECIAVDVYNIEELHYKAKKI